MKWTVLFVSHDTHADLDLCNHPIWIEKGEILQEGLPKDLCASYLQSFYEEQQGVGSTSAPSFGIGGARIVGVSMLNEEGRSMVWIVGGERVTIRIVVQANQYLRSPIMGFSVKDRKGQVLFGENTFLSYQEKAFDSPQESEFQAFFIFKMPLLPAGEYSIGAAVADGKQDEHEQHHWIHDAVMFKSESSSVSSGLIGIPMLDIRMENA
jgi:lipopolysaccharide transport system ATP-binding protein